ncbi:MULTISPECIES: RNA degradosome polyphosphate kinase [Pseudobutyrivibrio]|jgi:polyphosphate kinase|uniref:Polyphosphate kinase n=1 Tax=Pseudobutyrivibrio ruminis TaxID=46206 RepID=A0A2G3DVN1_9FIRM|nr:MULTISPECIES: RNA degradosome polyphosphate kinase [Pseudobutyrivibrio]MBE5902748.1 RNA degradosome polyphosphate kinase [Pseudobutyrivibrio sp.]PHU34920.1 polyphosphate kinase [Pseudobutyrivibrio ruminis]
MKTKVNISDFKNFDNRELSWLKFEQRVLNEATNKELPILERLKFVSITSSNLDEFFMVRVASLKDMEHAGYTKPDIAGMTPTEQLVLINEKTRELVDFQYSTFSRSLMPILKEKGILIYDKYEDLNAEQLKYVDSFFMSQVYPVLTPMAFDASRPFPLIRNKSLNIAALIEKKKDALVAGSNNDDVEFATVQVPSVLPRFISLPSDEGKHDCFILLEQIIERNMDKLFLNYNVVAASPYRIMRNADFSIDEEGAEDLLREIEKQIKSRQWGEVIRLEVESSINKKLLAILKKNLGVNEIDIYKIKGPIDLTFLMKLYGIEGHSELRSPSFKPQDNPRLKPGEKIFDEIKKGDILLHHPYETFDPVVDFIAQAAFDPQVLAIKQTLYRVSGNSPIIASLAHAAENGKQVTVLVELKARFDEENNIIWAKKLEKAGCHVIYGLVGLKTHCKIALVVRREEDGIKRYVHLGTGNYNDSTAKLYTDCGMLTCQDSYGEDATAVFNMLSGYSEPAAWNKLVVAPLWLRDTFVALINREIAHAKDGKEAAIIAKMNSLCDKEIIEKLYEASNAGVKIQLIVRGICCLKTGIPGVSENIKVTSIVGTYLEHARIFYFYNNGAENIYMGSADWMPRNLDRRVEIIFPVEDQVLKAKVKHILDVQLADTLKAYEMTDEANYVKVKPQRGKKPVGAQDTFCKEAKKSNEQEINFYQSRTFIPRLANEVFDE